MNRYIKPSIKIVNTMVSGILANSWSNNGQTGSAQLNSDNGTGTSALGRRGSFWDEDCE